MFGMRERGLCEKSVSKLEEHARHVVPSRARPCARRDRRGKNASSNSARSRRSPASIRRSDSPTSRSRPAAASMRRCPTRSSRALTGRAMQSRRESREPGAGAFLVERVARPKRAAARILAEKTPPIALLGSEPAAHERASRGSRPRRGRCRARREVVRSPGFAAVPEKYASRSATRAATASRNGRSSTRGSSLASSSMTGGRFASARSSRGENASSPAATAPRDRTRGPRDRARTQEW